MSAVPLVRSSSVLPLYRFLQRGGPALRHLEERLRPAFRSADSLLPVAYAGALFEEAARVSGVGDLGFRLGLETRIEEFGEWGALLDRSPTAGVFLQLAIAGHRRFSTGYRLWTVVRSGEVWLHLRYGRSLQEGREQVYQLSLALWLAAFRKLLGAAGRPEEIHLEGDPPRYADALAALATRGVAFHRPGLAIAFPQHLLARRAEPMPARAPAADPGPVPASDFAGSVRQLVASLLQLGVHDVAAAAEAAGTSERSFQRHLGEVGLTYSELVGSVRFEAARRLLADPQRKVIEVANELGYSDAANFTRAFRRWSGASPQRFRRVAGSSLIEVALEP
jgi:AraC-like DNA-binding protein